MAAIAISVIGWIVGPVITKVINISYEYLEGQISGQTCMKKKLEMLQKNLPEIQSVVNYAIQAQFGDQNPALNEWLWRLRDAIEEADDWLDEIEYNKFEKQVAKNNRKTKVLKLPKIGKRASKQDLILNRLEEVVNKLDEVSAKVDTFLHLVKNAKQEQQKQQDDLHKNREEGSLPKNVLIGRGEDMKSVIRWLRQTSNEEHPTDIASTAWYNNISIFSMVGRWLRQTSNEEHPTHIPSTAWYNNISIFSMVGRWLRQPSHEEHQTQITATTGYHNISLLSVVGHGGMGKTTLLQQVYNDEIIKEFDLKMWVCVSDNFDAKKVIVDMLGCLDKKERSHLESINKLQETLKSAVQSKKFLLILDDIWDGEEDREKRKWENVLAPLANGSLGSKILVTTRMDSVAMMMARVIYKKMETWRLKGLEEDECLQLLNIHAFADVENLDDHKKLRSISAEIVKKLSGSPLAAKVIGGALNSSLDERHWNKILNSEFISAKFGQNEILRLSYTFLPGHLRSCFAYCSIFPQDHRLIKEDLVRMWIAMGFIQPPSSDFRETIEDVGARYFDDLVKKSFFEKPQNEFIHYTMHDLLHELAQSISTQECFRFVGHEELCSRVPKSIRHLYIKANNLEELKNVINFKNLRSLYLTGFAIDDQDFPIVLSKIFKEARSLRLLYIRSLNLKLIPDNIGDLIHLRYLEIYGRITLLPRSLTKLYHLQSIFLWSLDEVRSRSEIYGSEIKYFGKIYHSEIRSLPEGMNNLSNLRYMRFPPRDKIPEMYGIGKLISLQRLDGFSVENKDGYRIGELEHMNNLRILKIKRVNNVNDAEEACDAKLCDKRELAYLSLQFDVHEVRTRQKIELDERVLDNLQPHNNLKELVISRYMGFRSAIWMNNAHLISNLERIVLIECFEWQILPPFGQLPFLKYLRLSEMPKVKRIENKFHGNDRDCVFPSLEVLQIIDLEALEDWFDAVAAANDYFFPCLIELYLHNCPNLQELPYLPPKLKELYMNNIGWKTLNFCNISKSIPLKKLKVCGCPNIAYVLLADKIAGFEALRCLEILDCPNLISLGGHQQVANTENCQLKLRELIVNDPFVLLMEPLRSITSLEELKIQKNDELVSFSPEAEQWFLQLRLSLHFLIIRGLKSLQALPSSLENISSLKRLHVEDVPHLKSLPNLPPSLLSLRIRRCHRELADRYNNPSGSDYHKIAHIPYNDISL